MLYDLLQQNLLLNKGRAPKTNTYYEEVKDDKSIQF